MRETIAHLMSLNRFEDVQAFQEPVPGGVRLRYVLVPIHPVDRVEFRGTLGLPEGDLRRVVTERFGAAPSAARAEEAAQVLRQVVPRPAAIRRPGSRRASRRRTTPIARRWCSTSRPVRAR